MLRHLLASTALATVIATSAFAQGTPAPAPAAPAATAPADTSAQTTPAPAAPSAAAMQGQYQQALGADQYMATDLTGETVYQSDAADAKAAGEIENFVIGEDGTVIAAIVDTDDFLEEDKKVAVPFDKLSWVMDGNNARRAVLTATVEELNAAPIFVATTATVETGTAVPAPGMAADPAAPTTPATTPGATATGTPAPAPADPATSATAATDTAPPAGSATTATTTTKTTTTATASDSEYLASVGSDQYLSDDLIGANVYSGPGDDAETIGSVDDLVIAKDGEVVAGVIGVGGFLGIGEKDVAVPFAELQLDKDDVNAPRVVLAATKEQLNSAPAFDDDVEDAAAATGKSDRAVGDGTAAGAAVGTAADKAATEVAKGADKAATATGNAADDAAKAPASTPPAAGVDATTSAVTTTTTTTGGTAADRSGMTAVTGPDLTAEKLVGTTVYGPNDDNIGSVGDIALSPDGKVDAIIIDVGGFLGMGKKPVAVAMDNLQFMQDANGSLFLYTEFTEEQLKNAPEYDSNTYSENRDTMRIQPGTAPAVVGTPAPAK